MKIPSLVALTCKEVVEIMGDYLADQLSDEDKARFEQHLYACTWCMTYLDQMHTVIDGLGALGEVPATQDVVDQNEAAAARERLAAMFQKWSQTP